MEETPVALKNRKQQECVWQCRDSAVPGHTNAMMRMSLSEKEVSQIHLMLTTLPLPPIPITLKMDTAKLPDGDTKMALDMALAPVMQDLNTYDGIVNSHSVFAAMSFFLKWSAHGSDAETQTKVVHTKDGALLMLIDKVIQYHCTHPQTSTYADADILDIFVKVSQAWIESYLPEGVTCVVGPAPKQENIGYEDNLHIAMTHYCYAQGVLYNAKNKRVYCATHEQLCETFRQRCKVDAEERGSDDADVDAQYAEKEHMEVAQLYSQFSYHKLLILCFNRLLKDSLHGHTYTNSDDKKQEVEKNAKDLLRLSYENYKSLLSTQSASDVAASDASPPATTGLMPLDEEDETAHAVSPGATVTGADTNDSTQSVSDVAASDASPKGPLKGATTSPVSTGQTALNEENETALAASPGKPITCADTNNGTAEIQNNSSSNWQDAVEEYTEVVEMHNKPPVISLKDPIAHPLGGAPCPTTLKGPLGGGPLVGGLKGPLGMWGGATEVKPDTSDVAISAIEAPGREDPPTTLKGPLGGGPVGVRGVVGETTAGETKDTEHRGGRPPPSGVAGGVEAHIDDSASKEGMQAVQNGNLTVTYNRSSADSTPLDAASGAQEPLGVKTHSVNPRDLGGYKSIFGIFILETAAFMDNDADPRLIHNMCTNLRHLNELLQQECISTQKAVSIIDIPRLITELRKTSNTPSDIECQLLELEATLQEKGVSCT